MSAGYPGSPTVARGIQAEIADATGQARNLGAMFCACGRLPMLVSLAYGNVQVRCFCGATGRLARTERKAIMEWNFMRAGSMQ